MIQGIKHNWRLFVVKPVLIFYGIQFAVTGSITTQVFCSPYQDAMVSFIALIFFQAVARQNMQSGFPLQRHSLFRSEQWSLERFGKQGSRAGHQVSSGWQLLDECSSYPNLSLSWSSVGPRKKTSDVHSIQWSPTIRDSASCFPLLQQLASSSRV